MNNKLRANSSWTALNNLLFSLRSSPLSPRSEQKQESDKLSKEETSSEQSDKENLNAMDTTTAREKESERKVWAHINGAYHR